MRSSELRRTSSPNEIPETAATCLRVVPLGSAAALQAGLEREVEARKAAAAARLAARTKRKGHVAAQKVHSAAQAAKPRVKRPREVEQGGFR